MIASTVLLLAQILHHLCSLTKQSFSFIKHEDGILLSCLLEDGIYVLGALSHPLAQKLTTVDNLQWFPYFIANSLSNQCLASARWAMEQNS